MSITRKSKSGKTPGGRSYHIEKTKSPTGTRTRVKIESPRRLGADRDIYHKSRENGTVTKRSEVRGPAPKGNHRDTYKGGSETIHGKGKSFKDLMKKR